MGLISSRTDMAFLMTSPPPRLGLGELNRISVRDASRRERQAVETFEADVQLVEVLPEIAIQYVQDEQGRRFLVDQSTERAGEFEIDGGQTYRALVTAEGHVVKISALSR